MITSGKRKRTTLAALAAAASLTAAMSLPGSASAATSHTGTEYFLIDISGSTQTVIAHGAFTGGGKDDASHESYDIEHLGRGSVRITHPDKDSHVTFHLNRKSCFINLTITGKYTLGHGTGRFVGVTGHGTYVVKEQGIAPRTASGACNGNAEPNPLLGYVNASGPISWQ